MTTGPEPKTRQQLLDENEELRLRLDEAEQTLAAIQGGSVDALVVGGPSGSTIYTLDGADRPYRLVVEQMQQGAATLFADGTVAYCNSRTAGLVGKPHSGVLGSAFADFVVAADRLMFEALLAKASSGTASGEIHLDAPAGAPVPVFVTLNPLPADCGAAFGLLVTDLTLQKHHERLAEMNTALHESERKLRASEAELREADVRKNQFLAMLSHELRNPLAPILHATQLLGMQRSGEDALHRRAREVIERQTNVLAKLVNDLLDIARLTTGRIELRRTDVDLRDVVRDALETSAPLMERHRHRIVEQLPPRAVWVRGDVTRLEQVLVNLLRNAAKYTEDGGTITISLKVEGERAVLRIRDSGVGIAPDILPHVFGLFVQADRSLERSQGGLGIGLHVVQRLVELHGGEVAAHSDGNGKGSEFTVVLPTIEPPAVVASPTAERSAFDRNAVRVLVVDDNNDACATLALFLQGQGYGVRTAHCGTSALSMGQQWQPDVVLLDIGLPGMNGYEVARNLRRDFPATVMRIVAVTGYGRDEDVALAQQVGFDAHLLKPVDPNDVDKLVATWRCA